MRQFGIIIFISLLASQVHAVGKINRYTSVSADYARNVNRYAATGLDAAYYNPAGLVFGRKGFGLKLLNQSTLIYGRFTITDEEALNLKGHDGEPRYDPEVENRDTLLPSPMLTASYNTGKWAVFVATGPVGGGGVMLEGDHPILLENSSYVLDNINIKVREVIGGEEDLYTDLDFDESYFQAATVYGALMLGASYRVNDWLALSANGKYVYAFGNMELRTRFQVYNDDFLWQDAPDGSDSIEVQGDIEGHGFAVMAGAHLKPMKNLNIALKYETLTEVEVTTTATIDTAGILTGEPTRNDVPAQFTAGVDYRVLPELSFQGSFGYFFNKGAEVGELLGYDPSSELENGWEVGAGAEYLVNDDLLVSAGYLYLRSGYRKKTRAASRFSNHGHFVGFGGTYRITDSMDAIVGLMGMIDEPGKNRKDNIELVIDMYVASVGMNFWF